MPNSKLRKVVVVFKTHFDLGFTGMPDEVMRAYTGPMFEAVRRTMVATANEPPNIRYCWTLPAWPLYFLLNDESVPLETRQAARKLVEENRLHWHAYPFTTHTAFCGLEDLVRGLHISRKLSEEFGRWPTGAKQTDVPGHTWILPTLLTQAGVKFLHLGCNSGSHAPHVPPFFWWEGPDGSRLLTFYSPGGYGSPLLPPDDWPYDTWLSVQQTVDNHGPHTPEELKQMRRTIEEGAPGVEILFGQLGDFSDSLFEHPEQLNDLPVVPYDLADTWIHGIGTMPREVARVRELRAKLLALECTVVAQDWPTSDAPANADFPLARKVASLLDAAYEQLLLFGEHTWGLDVKSTIKRVFGDGFEAARQTEPYKLLESSWVAKGAYVDKAEAFYAQAVGLIEAKDPYLLTDREAEELHPVEAQDIPEDNVLENYFYRIEVDPAAGGITSLIDKRNNHEWVDRSGDEPFGGYRYDIYSVRDIAEFMRSYGNYFQDWFVHDFGKQVYPEDSRHIIAYAHDFKVSKDGQTITLSGGRLRPTSSPPYVPVPNQTISITISLAHAGYIDLEYKVEGKEATPLAESTVVRLGLQLAKPTYRLKQTGSVIDPVRDIISGANRNLWCADWLDISDDRIGFAVFLQDMPLVSIGDTGIYRFEPDRIPTGSTVYAHLSNTQWGTNFRQWHEGGFNWRVRLVPHQGDWQSSLLWYPYDERQLPFQTPLGMRLLSLRPQHDGPGLIARFWNARGLHVISPMAINGPIKAIWRCDILERPVEQISIGTSDESDLVMADIPMTPFSIETLLIEFSNERTSPQSEA